MASNLFKVTFKGTLTGTKPEIFDHSQWFGSMAGTIDASVAAAALVNYVPDFLAKTVTGHPSITVMNNAFPSWVTWTQMVVAEWIEATNLQSGPGFATALATSTAGNPALGLPYQCSHAITLRSGTIGRRIYNRFFLPPYVIGATNGDGVVHIAIRDAIGAFLNAEQGVLQGAGIVEMVHYSPAGHVKSPLVDSYIGSVVDTQRRRRNAEPEAPRTTVAI